MRFGKHPTVSVILPTYNRAEYLTEAIESVIAQTFSDWELVIVDDGSTDRTGELVDPHILGHENIRYMKHRNRKQSMSRNAGIQASFGRFITFLDSDDYYLPEHLASRCTLLETRPEIDLVSGGFICDDTIRVADRHNPEKLVPIRECILGGTLFGKRETFIALEGFRDMGYAEDSDLWERASLRFPVLCIDTPRSYVYRRAHDSITITHTGTTL